MLLYLFELHESSKHVRIFGKQIPQLHMKFFAGLEALKDLHLYLLVLPVLKLREFLSCHCFIPYIYL